MRRYAKRSLAIFLSLSFLLPWNLFPIPAQAEASHIIIEEIAWAGSSLSTADEWIELANISDATTTIGGWSLRGAGTSNRTIFFPADASIPPHGTYVISNYSPNDASSVLADTQLATTTVSLSNSALAVELVDANGERIDLAGNGSAPLAGSASPFASMQRASTTIPGKTSASWIPATTSSRMKIGVPDLGTPGICDLCMTDHTPSESANTLHEQPDELSEDPSDTATTTENGIEDETPLSENTASSTVSLDTVTDETSTSTLIGTVAALHVALNEINPNPVSGHEWIEFYIEEDATSTDRELLVYDRETKIATIPAGTAVTLPHLLVFFLPSSKLNNDGDMVYIRETDGTMVEHVEIPELKKGETFAKDSIDEWQITATPTPGAENVITPRSIPSSSTHIITITNTPSLSNGETNTQTTASSSASLISILINEVVSNPVSGKEWIELLAPLGSIQTDRELLIYDSTGKIASIPANTPLSSGRYALATFSSSRLNNEGEHISVRETDGRIIDQTDVPALAKGEGWARTETGWAITTVLTQNAKNEITIPAKKGSQAPLTVSNTTTSAMDSSQKKSTKDKKTNQVEHEVAASSIAGIKIKNTPAKKTSTTVSSAKTANTIRSSTFNDMFDDTFNTARVRVVGTVATPSRFFGATHAFILLHEDGRGAIVYLPKHLNVPPIGSSVQVEGTISSTYQGPELRMKTTDIWMSIATTTAPKTRIVDLLAPGAEDAWSLVSVDGVVQTVNASSFLLTTADGVDVTVSIPSVIGFRTKRLKKQDRVRVTGLLNIKKDTPTIMPARGEDISIIAYAPNTTEMISATSTKANAGGVPTWIPFASAGGAVVATGAGKRLRELIRRRKLKMLMQSGK